MHFCGVIVTQATITFALLKVKLHLDSVLQLHLNLFLHCGSFYCFVSVNDECSVLRVKPMQKALGITNGTSGGTGQQQAGALCDISAQVQHYQQFLGEEHPQSLCTLHYNDVTHYHSVHLHCTLAYNAVLNSCNAEM